MAPAIRVARRRSLARPRSSQVFVKAQTRRLIALALLYSFAMTSVLPASMPVSRAHWVRFDGDAGTLPLMASAAMPSAPAANLMPQASTAATAPASHVSTITANFDGARIDAGKFIWFNSIARVINAPAGITSKIYVRGAYISFAANGSFYNLKVPDATLVVSHVAEGASTSFDAAKNEWTTVVRQSSNGQVFLSGLPFIVPAGGLPGGLNRVSWTATFYTDHPGLSLQWKWAGIPYSGFSLDNNALGVKAADHYDATGNRNSQPAGTPQNFLAELRGATHGGGANLTGSYRGQAKVTPTTYSNRPPIANAGDDRTVLLGSNVTLEGSRSSDADGGALAYAWTMVASPSGSLAVLTGANSVAPTFVADKAGSYSLQLTVSDGQAQSMPDVVVITTLNSPPRADAGADQAVVLGTAVQLDGSASSDADGDAISYRWQFISRPASSAAALSSPDGVRPSFVVDAAGDYVVRLIVNDGAADSEADDVVISTLNSPPVADAGLDQVLTVGQPVQLNADGSSDADGDALTYRWVIVSQPEGSQEALSDPTAIRPSFTASRPGTYVAQLIVHDGTVNSAADTVVITSGNNLPIANAGSDQSVELGAAVVLDGRESGDSDGHPLTYQWALLSRPSGSTATLSLLTDAQTSFVADAAGDYVAQLMVHDGYTQSIPDTVVISTINSIPVADAGADQMVEAGSSVIVNGAASRDADGDTLAYSWAMLAKPAGSAAQLLSADAASTTFTADAEGTYVLQLLVNDGTTESAPDTVTIVAERANTAPVAYAGGDQQIYLPQIAGTLTGTASDDGKPAGQNLTYQWRQMEGPSASIGDASALVTDVTLSDVGSYRFQLTVTDSQYSHSDEVMLQLFPQQNTAPEVNAGADRTISFPVDSVTLQGNASDDGRPLGSPLVTNWTMLEGPAPVVFTDAAALSTTARFPEAGTYRLQLVADDGALSSSDAVTVVVHPSSANQAPTISVSDFALTLPASSVQLPASVTDDGLPEGRLTSQWMQLGGPVAVVFADPSVANTEAIFYAAGMYRLQLSATDGFLSSSREINVVVYASNDGVNQPPLVQAGADQMITLPNAATLKGLVVDDQLPSNDVSVLWEKVSGPGEVRFSAASSVETQATFSRNGRYVLRLNANDSDKLAFDELEVIVNQFHGVRTNKGTDFWFMFSGNAYDTLEGTVLPEMRVFIAAEEDTSGTVSVPGLGFSAMFNVAAGQTTSVMLPGETQVVSSDLVEKKAIHVTSMKPVAVFAVSHIDKTTDGMMVLPTPLLGKENIAVAAANFDLTRIGGIGMLLATVAAVVATADDTIVTITPAEYFEGHERDVPFEVRLNRGDVYQLRDINQIPFILSGESREHDLTDTRFVSNKPVAVFGGHECTYIGVIGACNFLYEQAPPVESWGHRYVTVPLATRLKGDIFRIVASQENTTVRLNGVPVIVNVGQFFETRLTEPTDIVSDKPILVMQVSFGREYDGVADSDPFMAALTPVEQYRGDYLLTSPDLVHVDGTRFKHYFNLTVPTAAAASVKLDGVAVAADHFQQLQGSGFSTAQLAVSAGQHNLTADAPFGVLMYGYHVADGYGFAGGFALSDVPGASLMLSPGSATQRTGTNRCVVARVLSAQGEAFGGLRIEFATGPVNVSNGAKLTDVNGQATYCYQGTASGTDSITAALGATLANASTVWEEAALNQAPFVAAGNDQAITLPSAASLIGIVTDDGLPATGSISASWSRLSGPGTVQFSDASQSSTTATFSAAGVYLLQLSASDSEFSAASQITVTVSAPPVNQAPQVNAGPDLTQDFSINTTGRLTLIGSAIDDSLPLGKGVQLRWTLVSKPQFGSVVLTNVTNAVTDIVFQVNAFPGEYRFRLTADDSQTTTYDEAVVTLLRANSAPIVNVVSTPTPAVIAANAGILLSGLITDDGRPENAILSHQWTQVSGPGLSSIAEPNSVSTVVTFSSPGQYIMRLDVSDGELTGNDTLAVTVNPANKAPAVVMTSSASSITLPNNTVRLAAAISDDGVPAGGSLTSQWRLASGPAPVTFSNTAFDSVDVVFSRAGSYSLNILVGDGELTTERSLSITVVSNNQAPVANAGAEKSITLPTATVSVTGTASDDNLPAGRVLTYAWSLVSGPSTVIFSAPNSLTTNVTVNAAGDYTLRLTVSDGQLQGTSQTVIHVYPAAQNQAPTVNTGGSKTVTVSQLPFNVQLLGTVTDDALPAGRILTIKWEVVSAPGAATFTSSNSATTFINVTAVGDYILRLTGSDGQLSTAREMTLRIVRNNAAPGASAGPSSTVILPSNGTITGTATDDGLPAGSTLAVQWIQTSGPAKANILSPNSTTSQVSLPYPGSYHFYLTASDGEYSRSSAVAVIINAKNPNAAPVVTVAQPNAELVAPQSAGMLAATATDDGLPNASLSYYWIQTTGPPAIIAEPYAASTAVTFPGAASYTFNLIVSDGELSTTAVQNTIVRPPAPPLPAVLIASPVQEAEITAPTKVFGNVGKGRWILEYALKRSEIEAELAWTKINEDFFTTELESIELGTFDPTQLVNGSYRLRLTITDSYNQSNASSVDVTVSGRMKVGTFQIAFNDLTVPVGNIPVQVIRKYDSRERNVKGDFGYGWSLALNTVRLEKNGVTGRNWYEDAGFVGQFTRYCLQSVGKRLVTITFPDDRQYKFEAVSDRQCQTAGPINAPTVLFRQLPGSAGTAGATLVPIDGGQVIIQQPIPGMVQLFDYAGNIYNPTQFKLTTADGYIYDLDQALGVTKITEPNGETLTFTRDGITHSLGKSVTFTRDTQDRITEIRDPNKNLLRYTYDTAHLLTFTDATDHTVSFIHYNAGTGIVSHFLHSANDSRGRLFENSIDLFTGRLISTKDILNKSVQFTHDVANRTETITDRSGNPTVYTYDERGNVTSVVDAEGAATFTTYDENDNKLSETNALGKTSTYTYDGMGHQSSETDPLGNVTRYTYNARGQVLNVTDALGRTTRNSYDNSGNLILSKDALGNPTATTYLSGLPAQVTDAINGVTRFGYSAGRLSSQTDALNNVSTFTYDENGNKRSQTMSRVVNGVTETLVTVFEYDKQNRLIKTIHPDQTTTRTVYNALGQQEETYDALNRKTTYLYDTSGRVKKTVYADTTFEESTYDDEGRRKTAKDRAGRVTTFEYDRVGRLTKTIAPDLTFTRTIYDAAGRVMETYDALNRRTSYEYDDAGRRTRVVNALDQATSFAYDANGNQMSVTDALGHITRYEFDELGRQKKVIYHDQSFEEFTYDELGRQIAKRDQAGKVTRFGYDKLGRLTSVTDALNQVTTYGYDELGNRVSQTDAKQQTTRYEYDALGRRVRRELPLGQSESYAYEANGNLKSRTDFNGRTTTYQYDALNRLLAKTPDAYFVSNGIGAVQVSFTYNADGSRKTMSDASGTTAWTYDPLNGRLLSKQTPQGTLNYTYDAAGNLKSVGSSNAGGVAVGYDYDELHRLRSATDENGATAYAYDEVGNLKSYTYTNGVVHNYSYNTLNRLMEVAVARGMGAAAVPQASYAYTLGAAGNRTAVAELGGRIVSYGYDDIFRLTSESIACAAASPDCTQQLGAIAYSYDAVGNRTAMTSSVQNLSAAGLLNYDSNDRITTEAAESYDASGNTLAHGGVANVYDFENKLVRRGDITIVYNGDGNRVSKTVGGVTTKYLVDTNNLTGYAQVVEELAGGSVVRKYSYGLDLISKLETNNSQLSYYGYDGHGSVRQLTSAAGEVTDSYTYDAFGNLIERTGTTPNHYLYAGEQFDADLGLYYNRARYLDVRTGRFWGMDEWEGDVENPLTRHKYVYAASDPVGKMDASGLFFTSTELNAISGILTTVAAASIPYARAILGWASINAYRIPNIIGRVSDLSIVVEGSVNLVDGSIRLINNLVQTEAPYSAGNGSRGHQVGDRGQQNLARNFPVIDNFETREATSIYSTTRVSSGDEFLRSITPKADALKSFNGARGFTATGARIEITPQMIGQKTLLVAIPYEPLSWSPGSIGVALRRMEILRGIRIIVVPLRGLRGR